MVFVMQPNKKVSPKAEIGNNILNFYLFLHKYIFFFAYSVVKSTCKCFPPTTQSSNSSDEGGEMAQTQIVNTSPTAKYVANDQTVVFDNGKNQEKANLISQKENNGNTSKHTTTVTQV